MKIKRFFAPDMRQAIRQVRETFGADAVILSNKAVEGGVELVAAMDYDEASVTRQVEQPPSQTFSEPRLAEPPAYQSAREEKPLPGQVHSLAERLKAKMRDQQKAAQPTSPASAPAPHPTEQQADDSAALIEMRREMRALRQMMESGFSELSWHDMAQRHPQKKALLRRLMALDLHPELCRVLADEAEAVQGEEQAYRHALTGLVARMPVSDIDFLAQGGAVALVGPTGVGKTTTVAKLAARFCLRYGSRQLALITTDNYRIGAEEQLHTYGRILDVPVRTASDEQSLNAALNLFADRKLVLIDTAGMSQRDVRLGQQIALLKRGNRPIHTLLTLAATTQEAALEHAFEAFDQARPSACVVTKVDEACSLGGLLSVLSRRQLPLAFSTDGQKVPEDIHIGRPHTLVSRAVELARHTDIEIGEDLLAMKLGGAREHAHV
jgi:flagellar biosynthesis protein FlhF